MSEPIDYAKVAESLLEIRVSPRKRETCEEWVARCDAVLVATKLCGAWPLIDELIDEVIDIAHPSSDAYRTAKRLRESLR